jgi:hypothetical protein
LITVLSASLTITYCKAALDNLERDEQTNIRHNLEILMMDKYKDPKKWDDDFKLAQVLATGSLNNLAENAKNKKVEVQEIYSSLTVVSSSIFEL